MTALAFIGHSSFFLVLLAISYVLLELMSRPTEACLFVQSLQTAKEVFCTLLRFAVYNKYNK